MQSEIAHYFIVGYLLFPKLGILFITVEVPSGCFQAEISSKFVIVKTPCGLTNCKGVFVSYYQIKNSEPPSCLKVSFVGGLSRKSLSKADKFTFVLLIK